MSVKLPKTRRTNLKGVNTARAFFEEHDCVFQVVDQQNDFGKDAYVDLVDGDEVTPLCVAVQIKSGTSFKTASGDYVVPVDTHASLWRRSTVPVFGLVYDPSDGTLRWGDLTGHLREHPTQEGGSVPIPRHAVLDARSLRGQFCSAVAGYAAINGGAATLALLSASASDQASAIWDTLALGRHDARYLVILRRLLVDLQPLPLRQAITVLSYATPHPDVFWTKRTWIPPHVEETVKQTFVWTPDEIVLLTRAADIEEWGRGTFGQCVDMLLGQDPGIASKLIDAVAILIERGDIEGATWTATIALSYARDVRGTAELLLTRYPALRNDEWFGDVVASAKEFGELSLY
ncbi:MAG: DUF4365 domain-containing protein [Holophagales bacterium]|nr:DUF4365 domain-containing protein [Holophagales bacterium]